MITISFPRQGMKYDARRMAPWNLDHAKADEGMVLSAILVRYIKVIA